MSKEVAKYLLDIQAVFLSPKDPFTWASGIKSPIYCDNRLVLSNVEARNVIENKIAKVIEEKYSSCTNVVGTATAGIAHSAIVAHLLQLPNSYVRASNKSHGRQNMIEGKITSSDKVVIIEDLISTGGSVLKVIETIESVGAEVLGVVSIFSYEMQGAKETLKDVDWTSLTNIHKLCDVAVEGNFITQGEKDQILKFIDNPSDKSWMESIEN